MNEANPPLSLPQRLTQCCAVVVLTFLAVALWLWCLMALLYHPWLPGWLNILAAFAFVALATYCGVRMTNRRRAIDCFCAVAAAILMFSMLPRPTHDRPWTSAQATMPRATIDGSHVNIENLRRTAVGFDGGHAIEHYNQAFDLDELQSVWFGVHQFSQLKSLAHTFVSFGFADGEYLSISIESRRGKGDGFSPIAGMFRNYGMIYVIGDEMEVIGWRSAASDDPIYLYPIKANRPQMRAMLIDMLTRANQLAQQPEFYDTWTNNCTNNIVAHFNKVAPIRISPYNHKIALPGHTARVAHEHGLIDSDEPFERIQQRAQINALARAVDKPAEFSATIRRGFAK